MKVTSQTKLADILPLITPEIVEQLIEKADYIPLPKQVLSFTCGEFIRAMEPGYVETYLNPDDYAMVCFGRIKEFNRQMDSISKFMNMNSLKQTEDEERAARGIIFCTFQETILLTVTEYFGLKSFEEAENVPLSSYLLIHKKRSADAKYERQYQQVLNIKTKHK